jgi:hypothetical protein
MGATEANGAPDDYVIERGECVEVGEHKPLADNFRASGEPRTEVAAFVSASCKGERCSVCGEPAEAKLGEEIAHDDPMPHRHNLTAYVCREHFDMVLMPHKKRESGGELEPRIEPDNRRPTEPPQMSDAEFEACLQPVRMLSPEQARQMRAAVLNALGPTIMPSELLREKYDGPDSRLGGAAAYEIKLLAKALGEVLDEVLK